VPKTVGTAAGDAAAEAAMRMDGWNQSVVEMGTHYKEFLSNVAPLVLAAKSGGLEADLSAQVRALREQMIQRLMHFGSTHRIPILLAHTLNLETGLVQQEPPHGHWYQVMLLLPVSLSPQALQEILSIRQLYNGIMGRVQQDRQQLIKQLQQLLNIWSGDNRATDEQMSSLAGPHAAGEQLLDAIDSNLRREYILNGCLSRALTHILPPLVTAEICLRSYPFWPDLNHITEQLEVWQQEQQQGGQLGGQQMQQQQQQGVQNMCPQQQQQQQLGFREVVVVPEGEGRPPGKGQRRGRNQQRQQQQQQEPQEGGQKQRRGQKKQPQQQKQQQQEEGEEQELGVVLPEVGRLTEGLRLRWAERGRA